MKKILTIIIDGFGVRDEEKGNAIKAANMHNFDDFYHKHPHTTLHASEQWIGLLPGQVGNSEVGHLTIGAGRLIKSNEIIINDFFHGDNSKNANLSELLNDKNKRIHIMGLCSNGNIHAGIDDFISMFELLHNNGLKNVYFHLITDGRDTKVDAAYSFINQIESKIKEYGMGSIATICGRYYAMDRDEKYDRTKVYYDLAIKGVGSKVLNIENAIKNSYAKNVTDEFIKPIVYDESGLIKDGDALIWMNYRADRAKQILNAIMDPKFEFFDTVKFDNLEVYSFFQVDKNIKTKELIEHNAVDMPLGIYLSHLGLKQARISESEKFPHVTYFFDGGFNGKIENADKFQIPSPSVATYDLKPEMNAVGVTKKIIECMEKDYDFILTNFANPDMVGHTGNMEAATKACMAIDVCLGKIIEAAEENFYTLIIMADHGNADTMINEDGSICTTHSLASVPFVISDDKVGLVDDGDLTNVAPTILDYMDISVPEQMTADSILLDND